MSKLTIYRNVVSSKEEKRRVLDFAIEFDAYIRSLSSDILNDNSKLDFVVSMSNCRSNFDSDDSDLYMTESEMIKEAQTNNKVHSASSVISDINYIFKLPKELFLVDVPNHIENIHYKILPSYWKCPIALTVPKIERNINLIKTYMESVGYVMAASITRDRNTENEWIDIIFNPKYQESIREMLNDADAVIVHYSPSIFDEDIEENGIVPRDGTRIYKYKKRAFYLYKDDGYNQRLFNKMMKSITEQKMRTLPEWNGEYTSYFIYVDSLPDDIQFYYDPNAPHCVYTDKIIDIKYVHRIKNNIMF